MSKKNEYSKYISEYIKKGDLEELRGFLVANSNLPGPRGNLEMAYAFADCFDCVIGAGLWEFILVLSGIGSDEAPVGSPEEILPFCAALAAGSYYIYADEAKKLQIRTVLIAAMNDARWRMREGAAMGFQRIAEKDFGAVKEIFDSMYSGSNLLEKRGIIAALAHPPILKDKDTARYCLRISEDILRETTAIDGGDLKSEGFRVLSKGLEYALSVFTAYLPDEGFEMLRRFAAVPRKEIKGIIRSNLKKARLKKKFPREVEGVISILDAE